MMGWEDCIAWCQGDDYGIVLYEGDNCHPCQRDHFGIVCCEGYNSPGSFKNH